MGVVRGSKNPPYPTVSPLAQVGPETVDPPLTQAEATIEHCVSVERQVDKVLQKFLTYGKHCKQSLEELGHVVQLWAELAGTGGCPFESPTPAPLWACLGYPEATW